MSATFTILPERGVVAVSGEDARKLLQDLITNDLDMHHPGSAQHGALLSPQGKILFEFFVVPAEDGLLLETTRSKAADLIKRLTMYKLRARVTISDRSDDYVVVADWSASGPLDIDPDHIAFRYRDPRSPDLAQHLLIKRAAASKISQHASEQDDYQSRRVAFGIPDPDMDYPLGDTFPHEANFDRLNGISLTKGCFVGQEVVSRMQNKSVVRKRVVKITSTVPLKSGADIVLGSAAIGKVGTVAGTGALAMVRLDRAAEAQDKGQSLLADGATITVDPVSLAAYRKSVVDRPVIDL